MPDRRSFLKGSLFSGFLAASSVAQGNRADPSQSQWVSIIDLDRCTGCQDRQTPACVSACRNKNHHRFPNPKTPLQPYWPQKGFEDFSEERNRIDRLTPYNWTFVEKISLDDGRVVFAPRRCMHCFDAPCRKICPFGAIDRSEQGAVMINPEVCFGGAKCRDVCPWQIPQRQAGVGLYLDILPKFAGGGVMYKCDFCADQLQKGMAPACAAACPNEAIVFLPLHKAMAKLKVLAENQYVYGINENGGTATWYVSSVPFEVLQKALLKTKQVGVVDGRPDFKPVAPLLENTSVWASVTLTAPIAAIAFAYMVARRKRRASDFKGGRQ